jgi:hypothetical protein
MVYLIPLIEVEILAFLARLQRKAGIGMAKKPEPFGANLHLL